MRNFNETAARQEFERDSKLREEFQDVESYIAYLKAVALGCVRMAFERPANG